MQYFTSTYWVLKRLAIKTKMKYSKVKANANLTQSYACEVS